MDQQYEEGEIITNKPYQQSKSSLVIQGFITQEPCESNYSSSLQSLSEVSSQRNINTSKSSFKKISRSAQDLQNMIDTSSYICASYNFVGKCVNKDCKKKHLKVSIENGLEQLIESNLDFLDKCSRNGDKLKIPLSSYQHKLEEFRRTMNSKKSTKNQKMLNQIELTKNWGPTYPMQFPVLSATKNYPTQSNNGNGYASLHSSQQSTFQSHQIVKPQPQLDFKQLQELVDKQSSSTDLINEFKKDLMIRLKTDIDKMQDKLKTVKCLKRWVQDQTVDENEFYELYYNLTPTQQMHFMNFFKVLDLKSPELSYSDEMKQNFKTFMQTQQPIGARHLLEQENRLG